jgi:hypothetical protein
MTDHQHPSPSAYPPAGPASAPAPRQDDLLPIKPVIAALWPYRVVLRLGVLGLVLIIGTLTLASWIYMPVERIGSTGFRVTFEGAATGQYPNGMSFSTADIVSAPVLEPVFRANALEQYADFRSFRESIFPLESNSALQMLAFEYQAKLSDPRLTPMDRARMEDEYKKKRESLASGEFSLSFRRTERLRRIPSPVMAKVLDDTLAEWARQARDQRGAVKYDIPTMSKNILQRDMLADEDYIVVVDVLRSKVQKVLANIDIIADIPGALLFRTGKSNVSLAEIRSNLQDLLRFEVEPAISLIVASRLARDPVQAKLYVQDQLRQTGLNRDEALQRLRAIQDPLRDYVAQSAGGRFAKGSGEGTAPSQPVSGLMPQLSESFLQQLIQMSTQRDIKYRQDLTDKVIKEGKELAAVEREKAYYDSLARSMTGWTSSSANPAVAKQLQARFDKALQTLSGSVDDVMAIYEEVSSKNLNPSTQLYTVTAPYAERAYRPLAGSRLILYAVVGFAAAFFFLIVATLFWHRAMPDIRRRTAESGRSGRASTRLVS